VWIVAVVLGVVTVAALDLILLIGASGEPLQWFGILVPVLDMSLLASSITFGIAFFRRGNRLFGSLFLANPLILLVALMLRISGVQFSRALLFGADLYWLNLYLVGLVIWIREGTPFPHRLP
jgi:hypothetical protein